MQDHAAAPGRAQRHLPAGACEVVVQGVDVGAWVAGQVAGRDPLVPVQRHLLETVGVDPDTTGHKVAQPARQYQDELCERNKPAARQFHARERRCYGVENRPGPGGVGRSARPPLVTRRNSSFSASVEPAATV